MKTLLMILFWGLAATSFGRQALEEGPSRFGAVDIYLDPKGAPLAAYQLELRATNGFARIVGIEGGDHPAFHEPPFYDPRAMQKDRVILAAFSTAAADTLPNNRTRVATVHYETRDRATPQFKLTLKISAGPDGKLTAVAASLQEKKNRT
jgi:hypothetical protein